MALRPPWHLGVKCDWTESMQLDWIDFHRQRRQTSFNRNYDFFEGVQFLGFTVLKLFTDIALFGRDWHRMLFYSVSVKMVGFRFCLYLFGPLVQRQVRKHPVVGCVFQILLLASWSAAVVQNSLSLDTELLKHRFFLAAQAMGAMVVNWMDLPFQVQFFVGVPVQCASWLVFHSQVNFWATPMIFGAIFLSFSQSIVSAMIERMQWQAFYTALQLDRERLNLVSTQKTLHGMLSSFWDASCTCNMTGKILSSTPHLEQLLGSGRQLLGSTLCDFAATENDSSRLEAFLQTAMSSEVQQASSLQCTMHPLSDSLAQDSTAIKSLSKEVVVYAIKLPQGSTFQSSESDSHLDKFFVGIKEMSADMHIPDAPETTSAAVAFMRSRDQAIDDELISDISSDAPEGGIFHRNYSDLRNCRVAPSVASNCTSLAYSLNTKSTASREHRCVLHKSVQTLVPETLSVSIQADMSIVDDLPPPVQSNITMIRGWKPSGRPPKLISRHSPSTSSKSRQRVVLNTTQCAATIFRETPFHTAKVIIFDTMMKMNLKGKGCCFFHITLAAMMRMMRDFYAKDCQNHAEINPDPAWQCGFCSALNIQGESDNESDDGEVARTCIVCEREPPSTDACASAESISADVSELQDE